MQYFQNQSCVAATANGKTHSKTAIPVENINLSMSILPQAVADILMCKEYRHLEKKSSLYQPRNFNNQNGTPSQELPYAQIAPQSQYSSMAKSAAPSQEMPYAQISPQSQYSPMAKSAAPSQEMPYAQDAVYLKTLFATQPTFPLQFEQAPTLNHYKKALELSRRSNIASINSKSKPPTQTAPILPNNQSACPPPSPYVPTPLPNDLVSILAPISFCGYSKR